jgi:radical SAM protein with 4Fe4S-binding SPASM domain
MIPESICLMPWIHLYVDTNGNAKACCNTSITYGNVNKESIESIWNGDSIKKFRRNLLEGQIDKRCASCFKREAVNKSSIRTETLDKYKSYLEWLPKTASDGTCKHSKPVYLDIRYSNVCNLKCRTCWHGASSSWFNDAKLLKANFGDKAIIKATPNNDNLINDLLTFDTELEEVYFAGGEPLMMEEHYSFLESLLAKNQTNLHLRYNTNLSALTLKGKRALDYWKKFKTITLAVSIDAIGEKGEYIRSGLKWNKLLENIELIKKQCPHIKIQIAPTVSNLSILSLCDLHQFFVENSLIKINDIYLNVLDRPNYYNCKNSPKSVKEKSKQNLIAHIDWLNENNASQVVIKEFEAVIDYMMTTANATDLKEFVKQTEKLDTIRNEDFNSIFQEFVHLSKT